MEMNNPVYFAAASRTQSVRRTSLREKILTTKKDAQEEARLRLKAQEVSGWIISVVVGGWLR